MEIILGTVDNVLEILKRWPKWKQITETPERLDDLEKRIATIENQISGAGDVCPFCSKPAGELIEIKPHKLFGDAGIKVKYYKCGSCGENYDKEIEN